MLASPRFAGKQFVLCGHSLGGAIAAIVTTEILIERQKQQGSSSPTTPGSGVLCVTFGAPLFGDEAARLFLSEKQVAESMFHFVAERDPVPSLLSFAQSVSAVKHRLDTQIRLAIADPVPYLRRSVPTGSIYIPFRLLVYMDLNLDPFNWIINY